MHAAKERAGGFPQRPRRVAEQRFESRRVVQLAALDAPIPDAVVRSADDVIEALLARPQRGEEAVLFLYQSLRAHERPDDEQNADRQRADHQRGLDAARSRRECRGERSLEGRQCAIERTHLDQLDLEVDGVAASAANRSVNVLRECFDTREQRIGFRPYPHRAGHEADRTEATVQQDHAVDVGRIVARIEQARARNVEIGKRFFELDPRLTSADDDTRLVEVTIEVIFVTRLRVLLERLDGGVLRVRPRALGGDVSAQTANDLQARRAEDEQQQHDRHERPDQPDEAQTDRRWGRGRHRGVEARQHRRRRCARRSQSKAWATGSALQPAGAPTGPALATTVETTFQRSLISR